MFYDGTLQSGIAVALSQSKPVVCFVTSSSSEPTSSDNDENAQASTSTKSSQWERDWLRNDSEVASALSQRAVTLRIEEDSQEAGFLGAFCPIGQAPTLVIIYQGQVVETLNKDVERDEFKRRITNAIDGCEASRAAAPFSESQAQPQPQSQAQPEPVARASERSAQPSAAPIGRPATNSSTPSAPSQQRPSAAPTPPAQPSSSSNSNSNSNPRNTSTTQSYAAEQAALKKDAAAERARIRQQIEADKLERRARQQREIEMRAALAAGHTELVDPQAPNPSSSPSSSSSTVRQDQSTTSNKKTEAGSTSNTNATAVTVRLLNGSQIRSKLPSSTKIAGNAKGATSLRKWIDDNRTDGDNPYTLRMLLTPQPSRPISDSDEKSKTLSELGLSSAASLVLVPVRNFSEAYRAGGGSGIVRGGPGLVWEYVLVVFGWIWNLLATFLGIGVRAVREVESRYDGSGEGSSSDRGAAGGRDGARDRGNASGTASNRDRSGNTSGEASKSKGKARASGSERDDPTAGGTVRLDGPRINVRTLGDQRRDEERDNGENKEWYNGNQLNFAPNRKDEDDDE